MGGSQVFLEEGETQTVETMIKCIVVASGNDASADRFMCIEQLFLYEATEWSIQPSIFQLVFMMLIFCSDLFQHPGGQHPHRGPGHSGRHRHAVQGGGGSRDLPGAHRP